MASLVQQVFQGNSQVTALRVVYGEVVEAGRACEYLTELNTACSWRDRQFRSLIEARVQGEIYELLLGWIDALPQLPDWQACQSGSCGFSGKLGDLGPGSSRRGSGPRGVLPL